MTGTKARHPRCGGEWRGPFQTDHGPVEVCNTCGSETDTKERAMYSTTVTPQAGAKTYGPQQQKEANRLATCVQFWGADLAVAAKAGDLAMVSKLTEAIADATAALSALTKRAGR